MPLVNHGRARYVPRVVSESTDLPANPAQASTRPWSWRLILEFHGQRRFDRALPAEATVTLGESPASSLVVPGVGGAGGIVPVASDGKFVLPSGCSGAIIDAAGQRRALEVGSPIALGLGERAQLSITEHPGVRVELRREPVTRARFGSRIAWGELGRTLVYGAAVLALFGIGTAVREPVAEVLAFGDPDEDDSPIARAMFETVVELPPIHSREWGAVAHFAPPDPEVEVEVEEDLDALAQEQEEEPPPPPPQVEEPDDAEVPQVFGVLGGIEELEEIEEVVEVEELKEIEEIEEIEEIAVLEALTEPEPEAKEIGVLSGRGEHKTLLSVIGARGEVDTSLADLLAESPALDDAFADIVEVAPEPSQASHTRKGNKRAKGVLIGTAGAEPEFACENPEQRAKPNVDVVFVIDVSTTMGFMLDRVEQGIAEVDAELRKFSRDPRYGLVVFVDDVLVSNNGQPFADLESLRAEFTRWRGFTANNHQVKATETPNLDWPENSLDALHAAATQYAWRPADDTVRLVIHATDDDFREAPTVQSEQRVEHTYRETLEALRDHEVRVASFAARLGGECECLDVEPGWFKPFGELPSMPDGTGGAVFDIDEVAAGNVSFAAAIQGTVRDSVCTRYPVIDLLLGKAE